MVLTHVGLHVDGSDTCHLRMMVCTCTCIYYHEHMFMILPLEAQYYFTSADWVQYINCVYMNHLSIQYEQVWFLLTINCCVAQKINWVERIYMWIILCMYVCNHEARKQASCFNV